MSTGLKIIQNALGKLGAHSIAKPANTESIENGRIALNSYISQLQDDNIFFGAVPLMAAGEELSEPQGLTNVIEDNLAILLQPQHPGTQISPQLRVNANIGNNYMIRKFQVVIIPKQVVSNTMPLGAGNNTSSRLFGRVFAKKGTTIG